MSALEELIEIIKDKRNESDISNTLLRFCQVEAEKLLEKDNLQKQDYTIRFSNWLDKNYIKKKGAYYHKVDWEFSNGENNKQKLLSIFNRNVV